jgi:pimeloyl-ACP methyl ester carboxylesterase
MLAGDLVLIHGFWSSTRTWDRLVALVDADADLAGVRVDRFGYESPKIRLPLSPTRIPDYDDIAHSLGSHLALREPGRPVVIVTHSQGGLILQRHLAWMVHEGRARELARIRAIVLLACPNEGSEYLGTIRRALGFGRHPQAGQLATLVADATEARRTFLRSVVQARTVTDRECPIPVHAYAGRTDNVVTRSSAQSVFPNVGSLPGNHFSILDPTFPGSLTFAALKTHLTEALRPAPPPAAPTGAAPDPPVPPAAGQPPPPGRHMIIEGGRGIQIGDGNIQGNW